MIKTYRVLAYLIAACVLLQAAFIAFGTFGVQHDVHNGIAITDDEYNTGQLLHAMVGTMLVPLVSIVLLVVGFLAKFAGAPKWAGIVFGLVALQFLLALVSLSVPVLGLLHGLNAFGILAMAVVAARKAEAALAAAPAAAPAGATA